MHKINGTSELGGPPRGYMLLQYMAFRLATKIHMLNNVGVISTSGTLATATAAVASFIISCLAPTLKRNRRHANDQDAIHRPLL